jgi:putative membrane protein
MDMNRGPLFRLLVRWFVCSAGLWVTASLLTSSISYNSQIGVIIIAGLVLAIINAILKPLIIILSLPAILFSLGLFMIVINGFMVWMASKLYHSLHVHDFWAAMLAGIIIGLVNYLVTTVLEQGKK